MGDEKERNKKWIVVGMRNRHQFTCKYFKSPCRSYTSGT